MSTIFKLMVAAGLALSFYACGGNACDDLADKLGECDGYEAPSGGDADGECNEAAEKLAECLADNVDCDSPDTGFISADADCS